MSAAAAERPVALITGASSGIGAACAKRLAEDGFNAAITYASSEADARATAEACVAFGADTLVLQGDVSEDSVPSRLVGETVARWGRLDVLVNNAGVTKFAAPRDLDALTPDDFERIFAVNVTAAFEMAKAASVHLRASPYASIVCVTSHSGVSGLGSSHAYAASKGAANTLALGLARALAPEIRVNIVCPGYVDTPWHTKGRRDAEWLESYKERFAEIAPLKRLTTADDVAEAVSFFANGAKAITGAMLVIDGGTHLTIATPQSI